MLQIRKELDTLLHSENTTERSSALSYIYTQISEEAQLDDDDIISSIARIAIYNACAAYRHDDQYTTIDIFELIGEAKLIEYHSFMSNYEAYYYKLYDAVFNITHGYIEDLKHENQ